MKMDAFYGDNCRLTDCGDKIKRNAERNMMMKSPKNQNTSKDTSMTTGVSLGLAIGLSLGVLFGVVTDNIGFGMMIGVAVGLCGGSVADALKGKKKEISDEEKKNDDK